MRSELIQTRNLIEFVNRFNATPESERQFPFIETMEIPDDEEAIEDYRYQIRKRAMDGLLISDTVKHLPPRYRGFSSAEIKEPFLSDLGKRLGLRCVHARLQRQEPGFTTVFHVDDYDKGYVNAADQSYQYSEPITEADREQFRADPSCVERWVLFLNDVQPGEGLLIARAVEDGMTWDVLDWRQGQAFTWEQRDVPHGFFNAGFRNRELIRITGFKI